ncbi:MAG: hypothetical protein WHX60_09430 [Armatimonadota bacterium]
MRRTVLIALGILWCILPAVAGELFRFLHITDTHIGVTAHHQETREYVRLFNEMSPPPAFIVNTGDWCAFL